MTNMGNCYEAAGRFLMNNCTGQSNCEYTLVHAEVIGQGQLNGVPYGHAWVEDSQGRVHDYSNGRNLIMPKEVYYLLGNVENRVVWTDDGRKEREPKIYKYTWQEASQMMLDMEHWGPWELETESGL